VAVYEIEVMAEDWNGVYTNIALLAQATMSIDPSFTSVDPAENANDGDLGTRAITHNLQAGAWIKLSFPGSFMGPYETFPGSYKSVSSIVINGAFSDSMVSSELTLNYGKDVIYSNKDFRTGQSYYKLDLSDKFFPASPVPTDDEFWLLLKRNVVGHVAVFEIQVMAEDWDGVSTNIARLASATMSIDPSHTSIYPPGYANDGDLVTRAITHNVQAGAWIKLSFSGSFMAQYKTFPGSYKSVSSIVINGFSENTMVSSELTFNCGKDVIYTNKDFQEGKCNYEFDVSDKFALPPPAPAPDELWLIVRAPVTHNKDWQIDELELFAHEWESETELDIAEGGTGTGMMNIYFFDYLWVLLQVP
jgi:hypothetical protein